jgi:ADP-heptose:LPS heptosyltransferase
MLWVWWLRRRAQANFRRSAPIERDEMEAARSVLFAVFARYGDCVVALKCIREFIAQYPHKRYVLITRTQSIPYARVLLPDAVEIIGINKRHNPWRLWRLSARLKREPPDIGLDPWSHGDDSAYFLGFARRFFLYRQFDQYTREASLYRRPRTYLGLAQPIKAPKALRVPRARRVLISHVSTDVRKSLASDDLKRLLAAVRQRFAPDKITLAGFPHELRHVKEPGVEYFAFGKSERASRAFFDLLRASDLFIGVDSGPLHLAEALGVPTIGLFGPTAPEGIMDPSGSAIVPLRTPTLQGVFCNIRSCTEPVCIHQLTQELRFDEPVPVHFERALEREEKRCRAVAG